MVLEILTQLNELLISPKKQKAYQLPKLYQPELTHQCDMKGFKTEKGMHKKSQLLWFGFLSMQYQNFKF